MLTPPPKPRTKEEYAYDVLRGAILRCELRPGEKLVLDDLSEKIGVSAIPLRSAVQRLHSEGLVEIIPHTGAIVSDISPGNLEAVSLLLERLEILRQRCRIEPALVARPPVPWGPIHHVGRDGKDERSSGGQHAMQFHVGARRIAPLQGEAGPCQIELCIAEGELLQIAAACGEATRHCLAHHFR